MLTSIRYKELHAPHSGDPSRLSDARDSSHVTVADDDVDSYRGESEAVFAAGRFKTSDPNRAHHQPHHHSVTIFTHARLRQL